MALERPRVDNDEDPGAIEPAAVEQSELPRRLPKFGELAAPASMIWLLVESKVFVLTVRLMQNLMNLTLCQLRLSSRCLRLMGLGMGL